MTAVVAGVAWSDGRYATGAWHHVEGIGAVLWRGRRRKDRSNLDVVKPDGRLHRLSCESTRIRRRSVTAWRASQRNRGRRVYVVAR